MEWTVSEIYTMSNSEFLTRTIETSEVSQQIKFNPFPSVWGHCGIRHGNYFLVIPLSLSWYLKVYSYLLIFFFQLL